MDFVFVDGDFVWSDLFYFVRTNYPVLQLVVTRCRHFVVVWCTCCQRWFVYEDPSVHQKLWFDLHPCIVVPFVSLLIFTLSRVDFFL